MHPIVLAQKFSAWVGKEQAVLAKMSFSYQNSGLKGNMTDLFLLAKN